MLTWRCVKCNRIEKPLMWFCYTRTCALNEQTCPPAGSRRGTGQGTGATPAARHCWESQTKVQRSSPRMNGVGRRSIWIAWSQKFGQEMCQLPCPIWRASVSVAHGNNLLSSRKMTRPIDGRWSDSDSSLLKGRHFKQWNCPKPPESHLMGSMSPGSPNGRAASLQECCRGIQVLGNSSIHNKDTSRTFFGKVFQASFNVWKHRAFN